MSTIRTSVLVFVFIYCLRAVSLDLADFAGSHVTSEILACFFRPTR